jgi:PiT family inorganic phosphate transporter
MAMIHDLKQSSVLTSKSSVNFDREDPKGVARNTFLILLVSGLAFAGSGLFGDIQNTGEEITNYLPFLLLAVALFIALGFEFVNGFHDTANAVATVIYTHSLPPHFAVIWSGFFNFLGVLMSSGCP